MPPSSGSSELLAGVLEALQVGVEVLGADDLDVEQHPRVVDAAELVALAAVVTDGGRGDAVVVVAARDDVHLHQEAGHAEVVDHVGRAELELGGLVDRQHERRDVRRGAGLVDVGGLDGGLVDVVERPLPLLADDEDGVVGLALVVEHDVLGVDGVDEEDDHHDDRGDRVEDLERQVVARLDGELGVTVLAAVAPHGPEHQAPGDPARDQRGHPRPAPQGEDVLTLRGRGVRHGEVLPLVPRLLRATGQDDRGGQDCGQQGEPEGPRRRSP